MTRHRKRIVSVALRVDHRLELYHNFRGSRDFLERRAYNAARIDFDHRHHHHHHLCKHFLSLRAREQHKVAVSINICFFFLERRIVVSSNLEIVGKLCSTGVSWIHRDHHMMILQRKFTPFEHNLCCPRQASVPQHHQLHENVQKRRILQPRMHWIEGNLFEVLGIP